MRGREADLVVARVCCAEGEAASRGAALGDDAVVVVEDFFDGDEDFEVRVCGVAIYAGVVLLGFVITWGGCLARYPRESVRKNWNRPTTSVSLGSSS